MAEQIASFTSKNFKTFRNFDDAAESILECMNQFIEINTLFIAKNDRCTNQIVKVLNEEYLLLEEGSSLPFEETYCKLSVDKGKQVLVIPDITEIELTRNLNVTKSLGGGCFIGIPIYYENGENYGTICGLDNKPFHFTEKHIDLFETMAAFLTYVLELEIANEQIQSLSAPLVPITKGIAVLPVIGDISEQRAERIIHTALLNSEKLSLDYLIIDLSGILHINDFVSAHLLKIVKVLSLIGVTPILTGIRPDLAMKAVQVSGDLNKIMIKHNLEQALAEIGFILKRASS
jgi:rsbT co-antagonist protein RsbR